MKITILTKLLSLSLVGLIMGTAVAKQDVHRAWPKQGDVDELNALLLEVNAEPDDVQRKKCKKFCSLLVRNCLAVNGTLYVDGANFTTIAAIAASLGALSAGGVARVASALDLIANSTIEGLAGFPGVGGALEWGYFWATLAQASIAPGTDVILGGTPAITSPGITQTTTTQITVANAGIYKIGFSVTGLQESGLGLEFGITVNATPVPNSIYGIGVTLADTSGIQDNGMVLVELTAGQVITLRNVGSTTVTTTPVAGGATTAVCASLYIERVA